MLDPWIIEEIRRREVDRRDAPVELELELPLEPTVVDDVVAPCSRGVVVIDL